MAPPRSVEPAPDLTGKTALVTGSNSGIGYATASALAGMGAHVVLACRNAEKAQAALEAIRSAHPGKGASVEVMQLDLASLRSARQFADAWASRKEEQRRVDLLVCNGGATFVDFAKTEDGFERTYQTNYLTHFLLVRLLLPFLSLADAPRIIFVSSNAASWGHVSLTNLNAEEVPESSWRGMGRFKTGMQVYGNSKLVQMLGARELQRRLLAAVADSQDPQSRGRDLSKIAVHCVYPGFVGSEMGQKEHYNLPKWATSLANRAVKTFGVSIENGAKPTLYAALSAEAGQRENWGSYWDDKATRKEYPHKQASDDQLASEVWERSCRDAGVEVEL